MAREVHETEDLLAACTRHSWGGTECTHGRKAEAGRILKRKHKQPQ